MDLKTTIQNDMKAAMKAQEAVKLGALRMLISEVKKREIDKRTPLDEGEIHKTISSLIKQRQDSVEAFVKGNRPELADKERAEIDFLKVYLPAQLSNEELEALVTASIAEVGAKEPGDMGKVMKVIVAKVAGRADGKTVNELVRNKLAKK